MLKKKIGVGIIGTGRRGYSLGNCIAELRGETGFEITSLWNRTEVRMVETKTALIKTYSDNNIYPDITLYENYEDLINDFRVDLIMIVTSQNAHRSHAVPALRSGKKVFLDKPIAHNLKDAVAIYKEESKTGNPMFMGFTRRYDNSWTRIFDLVKDGIIGDVKMMLIRAVIFITFIFTHGSGEKNCPAVPLLTRCHTILMFSTGSHMAFLRDCQR